MKVRCHPVAPPLLECVVPSRAPALVSNACAQRCPISRNVWCVALRLALVGRGCGWVVMSTVSDELSDESRVELLSDSTHLNLMTD